MMIYIVLIITEVYLFIWNYLLMFIFNFKSLLLILISLVLSGCGAKEKSISQICEETPGICNDFHEVVADCRYQRAEIIRLNYYYRQDENETNIIPLLDELNAYKACLDRTLYIAYKRYKDRKQKRLDNYLASQKLTDELLLKSVGTQDPNLAYYLWKNVNDLQAKKVFLAAATKPNLSDPSLLAKLAVYFSADEPQKSLNFYYQALRESKSIEKLPNDIFIQLVSLLFNNNEYEEAYIWAKIVIDTYEEDERPPVRLELIADRGFIKEDAQSALETKAGEYYNALKNGMFKEQPPHLFIELSAE